MSAPGSPVEQALVDKVAEAIADADDYYWHLLTPDEREPYYVRARAAIEAMELTEERQVHYPRLPIESDTEYVRLVGPWRTA